MSFKDTYLFYLNAILFIRHHCQDCLIYIVVNQYYLFLSTSNLSCIVLQVYPSL